MAGDKSEGSLQLVARNLINRKARWGFTQSRLIIQPVNTAYELDPNWQS